MNTIKLYNGIEMPCMGIGTNWMDYKKLRPIIQYGYKLGYRAIDTARDYGNEPIVGKVIHDLIQEKIIERDKLFITTKIGNGQQREGNIEKQLDISLKNLRTDYIDLWLMHWPYPNYYEKTWEKMIEVYKKGKVRAIGVANYDIRHFKQLLSNQFDIIPMVNQIEYHPLRTVPNLIEFMKENNIMIQSYAPLCRMIPELKENKILNDLSNKYHKSIGQIILRWHVQQLNDMPVFKTYNPLRLKENINIFDFKLTNSEMNQIYSLNINYKYHIESINCPGY